MKNILLSVAILVTSIVLAQEKTGVNTTSPNATLDVKAQTTDGSQPEGILTPQMTGDQLKTMTTNLTILQNGMLVYVTSAVTTADASTININFPGYYRFNADNSTGTLVKSWIRLEPSALEKVKSTIQSDKISYRLIGDEDTVIYPGSVDIAFDNTASRFGIAGEFAGDGVAIGRGAAVVTDPNNGNYGLTGWPLQSMGTGSQSIAIGYRSTAIAFPSSFWGAIAIGSRSSSIFDGVAIGYAATTGDDVSDGEHAYYGVAIGSSSDAHSGGTAIGSQATAYGQAVALGIRSGAKADTSIAIGFDSKTSGYSSVAIGVGNSSNNSYQTTLGYAATNSTLIDNTENTLVINNAPLFKIGNGTARSQDNSNRSDALTILRDARVGIDIDNFENTTSNAKLQVNGDVKITGITKLDPQNIPAGGACESGSIGYGTDGKFYACENSIWMKLVLNN